MQEHDLITLQLPSNVNAERSVIGAIMQDATAANVAFERLSDGDFYSPEHREIFSAMVELHKSGQPIDMLVVNNILTNRGTLEGVGGASYLLQALRYVPTTANTNSYIDIVLEKATLRKLISATQEIQKLSYEQSTPLPQVLNTAEKLIFDIVMRKTGQERLIPISKVLSSTFDQIEKLSMLKGKISGVPTGIYDLDRLLTGMHGGELILVGARPGMGKTAMGLSVAHFAAKAKNTCVAVFSMEMPAEQNGLRLLCSSSGIDMQKIRKGMLSDNEWVKLGDNLNKLSNMPIYIDDTSSLTPSQLRSRCRRLVMEQGLGLIVLDYLGLMSSDGKVESRQNQVSEISRQLKSIALELRIPVLACAQLNRGLTSSNRKDKRPQLSDFRDSGSIEQDADVVLFLHRPGYYINENAEDDEKVDDTEGEIIIAKQRNGPVGTVEVEWQKDFARYTNKPNTLVAQYT